MDAQKYVSSIEFLTSAQKAQLRHVMSHDAAINARLFFNASDEHVTWRDLTFIRIVENRLPENEALADDQIHHSVSSAGDEPVDYLEEDTEELDYLAELDFKR